MPLYPCQAVGCGGQLKRGQFLCRPHWYGLPQPLRTQVNATWKVRRAASGPGRNQAVIDHVEACDEARRYTADKEGRLSDFTPDAARIEPLNPSLEKDDHG
jgi:hypothetical protein